mmetsp:Transcript_14936/g.46286  ORF Transcript_14936/g.46286 Transcript_14936/m.46286 type:complete len:381 (-) Transcript_14936:13-1155(-)
MGGAVRFHQISTAGWQGPQFSRGVGGDLDELLAADAPADLRLERRLDAVEVVRLRHVRLHRPGHEQRVRLGRDGDEARPVVRAHDVARREHVVHREPAEEGVRRQRRRQRDVRVLPAEGHRGDRVLGLLLAEAVESAVDSVPVGRLQDGVLERRLVAVVDDRVPLLAQPRHVVARRGRDHLGPRVLRQLHREVADAAGARRDEDGLTRAQVHAVEERLVRGPQRARHDARRRPVHALRHRRDRVRVGDGELGVGPVRAEHVAEVVHAVARLERRDIGTHRVDHARAVAPEHRGEHRPDGAEGRVLEVDRVRVRRHHLDAQLPRSRGRDLHALHGELGEVTALLQHPRLHRVGGALGDDLRNDGCGGHLGDTLLLGARKSQ